MSWILLHMILMLGFVSRWTAANPLQPQTKEEAMEFLKKYAYMGTKHPDEAFGSWADEDAYDTALTTYQNNMGLNVTGQLDAATLEMMAKPRCGLVDMRTMADVNKRRKKRYALQGSRWSATTLTYRFINHSPDLPRSTVEGEFRRAFRAWSDVTSLSFQQTTGTADIDILFAAGEHGDGAASAFDGRGGTLAHAYYPQFGGDAHFDEAETWTSNAQSGINLYQVAVHEIGHSLGLGHSNVREAIMFPTYTGYNPSFTLDIDDINGIQAIYGSRITTTATQPPRSSPTTTSPTTTTPTPPGGGDRNTFCSSGKFDGVGRFNGDTIAFQGELYAKLDRTGIVSGYPRRIQDDWSGLSQDVDAVLDWVSRNRIYVFKGTQYWRYEPDSQGNPTLQPNYPRNIASGFPGLPNDIDAAFVWGANGRSYVFKGSNYYRLRRESGRVDNGYPRSTSVWNLGIASIDAAFVWENRKTYFFNGNQYYRYDDNRLQVDSRTSVPYPRSTSQWWLACTAGGLMDMEMNEEVQNGFIDVTGSYEGDVTDVSPGNDTYNSTDYTAISTHGWYEGDVTGGKADLHHQVTLATLVAAVMTVIMACM